MNTLRARAKELKPNHVTTTLDSLIPLVITLVVAFVLHIWVKPHLGDFYAKVLLDIGINIILAVSLTIVNGFTGQFSIGHAAFMMVGAYTAASIVYYGSLLSYGAISVQGGQISSMFSSPDAPWYTAADAMFLGSLIAGGLVAALCGYIVGLPSLRLKGDYLAIVTLGFGEIVRVLVQSQTADVLYTADEVRATPWYLLPTKVGGALGFSGLPFYSSLFWVFVAVGITLVVAYRLKESATGRAFLSIREDEVASEAMGVNTTRFKVRAFVIAAFFAGIAGGLFAHTVGVQLNPGELGFQKSFDIIIMVVLGGLGSISGATIAAAIVTILPEILRNPAPLLDLWPWIVGVEAILLLSAGIARARGGRARLAESTFILGLALLGIGMLAKWAVSAGYDLGSYRMIIFAVALVLMMILRPQGLFGVREFWDGRWGRAIAKRLSRWGRHA